MNFIPVIAVLPPGHGKTTMHNPSAGWIDAGSIVSDKVELRNKRRQARESGNWDLFDDYWSNLINKAMPLGTIVLMCPAEEIADRFPHFKVVTFILEQNYFASIIDRRPKSGAEFAYNSYFNSIKEGSEIIRSADHDSLKIDIQSFVRDCDALHGGQMAMLRTSRLPHELVVKIYASTLPSLASAFVAGLISSFTFSEKCNGTKWDNFSDYWAALKILRRPSALGALSALAKDTTQCRSVHCKKVLNPVLCWKHQCWNNRVEYQLAQCDVLISEDARDSMNSSTCYNDYSKYRRSQVICRAPACDMVNSLGLRIRISNNH